jgi:predicted nucleic acid-binding protein
MFLIDTSAWIFALKKNFHPMVKERVDSILLESDVAITGIITLELLGGARTEKEYIRLRNRLDALYYIEAERTLWDRSTRLAFDLKRKGFSLPSTDIFIAAAAIQEKAILLHADAHFDIIAERSALKAERLEINP